jgi:WD40 repeat protein
MPVVRIDGHPSAVNDVAFSPDGRLVATCCSSDVYVWNARTGEQVHHFANVSSPRCVAFSPDNRRLMSGGYYTELIIWDAVSGKEVQRLRTDPPTTYLYVQSLAYLPDPRGAVTGSNDGTIRVWRLPD